MKILIADCGLQAMSAMPSWTMLAWHRERRLLADFVDLVGVDCGLKA
jgi:hypothetical protein